MPISEAAMDGIKVNGLKWKRQMRGTASLVQAANAAFEARDLDRLHGCMRRIGKKFRDAMGAEIDGRDEDALQWFEEETADYEFENGDENGFKEEFNFRLGELYDWADYNRVLVC